MRVKRDPSLPPSLPFPPFPPSLSFTYHFIAQPASIICHHDDHLTKSTHPSIHRLQRSTIHLLPTHPPASPDQEPSKEVCAGISHRPSAPQAKATCVGHSLVNRVSRRSLRHHVNRRLGRRVCHRKSRRQVIPGAGIRIAWRKRSLGIEPAQCCCVDADQQGGRPFTVRAAAQRQRR